MRRFQQRVGHQNGKIIAFDALKMLIWSSFMLCIKLHPLTSKMHPPPNRNCTPLTDFYQNYGSCHKSTVILIELRWTQTVEKPCFSNQGRHGFSVFLFTKLKILKKPSKKPVGLSFLNFHIANFFRFIAVNLSLTQLETWFKPL